MNIAAVRPRAAAVADELRRQRRLAGARGADDEGAGAALDAAAEQRVELGAHRFRGARTAGGGR